uniref:Nidogen 2 n=1 Tax=Callorhinchus milii TaxID=7868 RepID=A0A4W3IF98_CALMI
MMPDRGFVLLLKLHCILSSVHALQREDLFPFGPHRGDLILGEGDDETSQVVKLKRPLMFYDTQFRSLYVGTNGIISTQDFPMETQYVDDGFPTDFPVIAAYLSDIDTSRGRGRIFYRADDSPDILHRAAREIRRGFPRSSFSPSDAFIATWENVAPYEEVTRSSPSSNRFNTFQAVLAFDESNTYAIFLYPEDGLQFFGTRPKESYNVQIELPARVGFSRGETEYIQWKRDEPYYSLTSNEQSVKNLYQMGNSGTRGVWIFHIGGASQFNNVMQAQAGEKPSRENIVTLDSTLNGPVKLHIPEPDYPEVDDYDEEFDEDDDETFDFSPLAPTDPRERVHNIPEQPPYPDAGIIPPHPEGYPEAGVVSSYPEARGLPLYPERYQEAEFLLTKNKTNKGILCISVFTYSTDARETCERNQGQCSQYAYCADYSSGFCCHCHSGYYGNGRQCLVEGTTQRVNGKVNGKLVVGASRTPVEIRNADLHAYVVVSDGRAYTAISHIPESVGWALQPLSAIGGLFGWLFALQQPGFKNGFSVAGAKFIRNVDITFYPGNERLNIIQVAQGLDTQSYLSVIMEIEGQLPVIPRGASVQIQPYREVYHRSNSVITSKANREYSVLSSDGETQTLRYDLRQNITYHDCEHSLRTFPTTQQLNVARVFVLYDQKEKAVRYAMTNEIGSVEDDLKPEHVNPCYDGSHDCDVSAQCFPGSEQAYICRCAEGYQGDGKVCTDIDECADGGHYRCGSHATCLNLPGLYRCECHHGYQFAEDGRTCVLVDKCAEGRCHPAATCYNIPGSFVCQCNPGYEGDGLQCRPVTPDHEMTACEHQRERLQAEYSSRGDRPHFTIHIPQCDEHGNFRPVQCHTNRNQCWCVDKWGREVPGTRKPSGMDQPRSPTERPKTACEMQRESTSTEFGPHGSRPHFGSYVTQCDDEGNYIPLQCHSSTGQCWCVDDWGREIPGTKSLSGSVPPQCGPLERPKTACEYQRDKVNAEYSPHGARPSVGFYAPECDEEGEFRPLQCHGSIGQCWCVNERGQEIPGSRTFPGTDQPQCGLPERPKTACEDQRDKVNAEYSLYGARPSVGFYAPECDEDGKFRPLQCHGSIGQCWCVNERGQEIPGTRNLPGTDQPRCGLPERPKTACEDQRDRVNAEYSLYGARPSVGFYAPECDEDGKFRPLQCHGSIGQCWCVNERGQEIPGTRSFPGTDQPRCGLPEPTTRPQTLCERWRQMSETSGTSADQYVPQCDEYGNFSPMQCRGNRVCWCVDKDGREIQGTGTQTGILPACIPTVAPPTVQPTPSSLVTTPSTGTFLLYAQGQHIGYLPLNGTQLNTEGAKSLLALHGSIVIGIDYDCREKMVYWTDVAGRTINRISLEIGAEPEIMINSGLTSPEGLTIDYLRRLMFWTDSGSDKIEVAKVDGTHRRVLFDTDLVNPRAIVVDSLSGNLYWTDWNREAPKIETSYIDGTNRRVLVKDDIGLPNGLTFDPFSLQLCWADAGTKNLECIFPDGTGRHVVQLGLNYPFSIVAYSNHFYYTDWRRDGVIVVNKANGQTTDEFLPDQRSHLYGITVAYPSCPHGKEP